MRIRMMLIVGLTSASMLMLTGGLKNSEIVGKYMQSQPSGVQFLL